MDTKIEPILVNISQAAELLALSERFVWKLVHDGKLKSTKIGKARRVFYSDLRAFAEKQGRR